MKTREATTSQSWTSSLYNKTRHIYIYMLPLAGQTTGPIELKFFVDSPGCYRLRKNRYIFFNFFSTGNAGPSS